MRLFFGLELDERCALKISDWRDRQLQCAARPVPPANFHVTLAFLGQLPEPAIERLCLSVDDWLESEAVPGSSLSLEHTGYWHKPGVYWLGPQHWPDSLTRLASKLKTLGTGVGGKRDHNTFTPHITLFRGCDNAPSAPHALPAIALDYDHFTLFESRQGKRGVSYHPVAQWPLRSRATST